MLGKVTKLTFITSNVIGKNLEPGGKHPPPPPVLIGLRARLSSFSLDDGFHVFFLVVVVIPKVLAVFVHFGSSHLEWSVNPWFWDWLVFIPELFWWMNYVFILFNHLLNTLSWNRFGFYVFSFSNSR